MKRRLILKVNENYKDRNLSEKDFNIEIYILDCENDIVYRKGFLYDMDMNDVRDIGREYKYRFEMGVEIIWNENSSEVMW